MKYRALATDYDGTLATDGVVDAATLAALDRYRAAGGRLLLVTGRILADLQQAFPEIACFDAVIAENGAVSYQPARNRVELLGDPLPATFIEALEARQVSPILQGQILVATWEPHGETVERTLQDLSLQARVILNKRAVMVLPAGIDKASGLRFALAEMGLAAAEVAGIGDAENDRDLLKSCGLGVAVANALPDLKAIADRVTARPRGAGVRELVDWILSDRC